MEVDQYFGFSMQTRTYHWSFGWRRTIHLDEFINHYLDLKFPKLFRILQKDWKSIKNFHDKLQDLRGTIPDSTGLNSTTTRVHLCVCLFHRRTRYETSWLILVKQERKQKTKTQKHLQFNTVITSQWTKHQAFTSGGNIYNLINLVGGIRPHARETHGFIFAIRKNYNRIELNNKRSALGLLSKRLVMSTCGEQLDLCCFTNHKS